jgi:hypothetical protein
MAVIKMLLVGWALIGMTAGSAWGGVEGAAWGDPSLERDSTFPWGFIGSVVGCALMGLVWLVWEARRKTRIRTHFLSGTADADPGAAADRPRE